MLEERPNFWSRWLPAGHVARRLSLMLAAAVTYALLVAVIIDYLGTPSWKAGAEWAAINGLVLGILLVFRNKEAYERWWEGRKLWGQLINDVRNLALKVRAVAGLNATESREFSKLLVAFPHALKSHLRGEENLRHVPGFEKAADHTDHLPQYIAGLVFEFLARLNREGRLRDTLLVLDPHARSLMDVCGACERIRSSPVPFSYRALLREGNWLYVLLAPWALSLETGYWGIPILGIAFYFLMGIELIAEDVEEPFGLDKDDLPLERFCETIRASVVEVLGEPGET